MRFRTALSLATFFLACFTVAVWSQPLLSKTPPAYNASENQSVSGKISAVGDASFAVDVEKNQKVNTVQFLVDQNTKFEGRLSVGAQASVEYRSDGGNNIATHVVVEPSSGS